MMIFPVHIVGYRAADGHESRTRRDRQEPAARDRDLENIREAHSRLTKDVALLCVKTEDPVQAGTLDQVAAVIQAGIAVTSAQSVGQQ